MDKLIQVRLPTPIAFSAGNGVDAQDEPNFIGLFLVSLPSKQKLPSS
jgi:hypothetical protein